MSKPYTEAQKDLLLELPITRLQLLDQLMAEARNCFDAIVELPATNEAGEKIIHGCNLDMHDLALERLETAQPLFRNCSEEEQAVLLDRWQVNPRNLRNLK